MIRRLIRRARARIAAWLPRHRRAQLYRLAALVGTGATVLGWATEDQVGTVLGFLATLLGTSVAAAHTSTDKNRPQGR